MGAWALRTDLSWRLGGRRSRRRRHPPTPPQNPSVLHPHRSLRRRVRDATSRRTVERRAGLTEVLVGLFGVWGFGARAAGGAAAATRADVCARGTDRCLVLIDRGPRLWHQTVVLRVGFGQGRGSVLVKEQIEKARRALVVLAAAVFLCEDASEAVGEARPTFIVWRTRAQDYSRRALRLAVLAEKNHPTPGQPSTRADRARPIGPCRWVHGDSLVPKRGKHSIVLWDTCDTSLGGQIPVDGQLARHF